MSNKLRDEFRAAGEFYGHLLAALACSLLTPGDLTMRYELKLRPTDTDTTSGRGFVYQWDLKMYNRHVSAEHRVTGVELMREHFLSDRAKTVAARWRREIKDLQG